MPYGIKKYKSGYRVYLLHKPNYYFSKKPQTYEQALKQLYAIKINELKKYL